MSAFPKNIILGILITILIITTIIFGVFWVQTKREARSKNPASTKVTAGKEELQARLTEQEPQTSRIDTSDWKTYRNEKYGFEVRHPSDLKISERPSGHEWGLYIETLSKKGISIEIIAYETNDETLENLVENKDRVGNPLYIMNGKDYQEISINGERAFKYINHLNSDESSIEIGATIILLKGKYYYQIMTGNQYAPEFTGEIEKIYNAFIETFKFTK